MRAALLLLAAAPVVTRPLWRNLGATRAERAVALPGDGLVPGARGRSTMAVTLDAPPEHVWPWLAQMGQGRAGWYSWDRLDNGGRPSATRIHAEWQGLRAGDRLMTVPDGRAWFDVAVAAPPHTLVLRATLALPSGRSLDPEGPRPRAWADGVWSFHLLPDGAGGTRLLVRSEGAGEPRALLAVADWLFWHPVHFVMQRRQLHGLRLRASRAWTAAPSAPSSPATSPPRSSPTTS